MRIRQNIAVVAAVRPTWCGSCVEPAEASQRIGHDVPEPDVKRVTEQNSERPDGCIARCSKHPQRLGGFGLHPEAGVLEQDPERFANGVKEVVAANVARSPSRLRFCRKERLERPVTVTWWC
jgi:hypothetical protein